MSVSKPTPAHCSDEQLLRHADGELSIWNRWRTERHLGRCQLCRDRKSSLHSMLQELSQSLVHAAERERDAAGPRAMLRARIAQPDGLDIRNASIHRAFARVIAYASVLLVLGSAAIGSYLHSRVGPSAYAQPLPDPAFTPGSTRTIPVDQLCTASADAAPEVSTDLKQTVFREYGIKGDPTSAFEVDYLITPGLGGSEDVRNLWPEPHGNTEWNSYVKDQLEDRLHHMVCTHQIDLGEAQRAIASNWIIAYKKYFHTDRPLQSGELRTDNRLPALFRLLSR